mgnify:CR=1 FL=1
MTRNLVMLDGRILILYNTISCLRKSIAKFKIYFLVFSLQTRTSRQSGMLIKLGCTIAAPTTIWVISIVIRTSKLTSQSSGITNLEAKII